MMDHQDEWPEPGEVIVRWIEPASIGGCGLVIAPPPTDGAEFVESPAAEIATEMVDDPPH